LKALEVKVRGIFQKPCKLAKTAETKLTVG
jgi:hypothetical protein